MKNPAEDYMPELPEVETIKTAIENSIGKTNIIKVSINNKNLREKIPDDLAAKVERAKIVSYGRRAKYIVISLDNGLSLIWHLGMSGRVKISESMPELAKHDHIVIETGNGVIVYNDARRFGLFTYCPTDLLGQHRFFAKMGVEPFDEKLTDTYLAEKLKNKNIPIKTALLDQSIITGIGNIYASESLYLAQINPNRAANSLSLPECGKLIKSVIAVLTKAIAAGGSTLKDYQKPDGSLGYFQNMHCVYNKTGQKCPDCSCDINQTGGIRKTVLGGRSTFFCPVRQK